MKTVYYDSIRGLLAVKPISYNGKFVTCKVTARNVHSGYKTGETLECFPRDIVRPLSGMRCYSVGVDEINRIIGGKA